MANWITVKGRHIDLDDPHNPVTGDGNFGDLKSNTKTSKKDYSKEIERLKQKKKGLSIFSKEMGEIQKKIKELEAKQEAENKKTSTTPKRTIEQKPSDTSNLKTKVVHSDSEHKNKQLEIIKKNNPMRDDYHTGIRSSKDIYTLDEAFENDVNSGDIDSYPDLTQKMLKDAVSSGTIMVYSSKPISQGGFISPSRMMAQDYAGKGKVYSQRVKISDVAWINTSEGQFAKVD